MYKNRGQRVRIRSASSEETAKTEPSRSALKNELNISWHWESKIQPHRYSHSPGLTCSSPECVFVQAGERERERRRKRGSPGESSRSWPAFDKCSEIVGISFQSFCSINNAAMSFFPSKNCWDFSTYRLDSIEIGELEKIRGRFSVATCRMFAEFPEMLSLCKTIPN